MSTTIDIRNLSKHYAPFAGSRGAVTKAVDNVSLSIPAGSLFFLLGPSGCGKTTLLRMIAGFIEPTSGSISFNARDVTHLAPNKRNTGMVFQSYALWPHMTVAQNVAYGLSVRRVPRAERDDRVLQALRDVRMDAYAKRKPNQLSGGQQQRVALARALVIRPEVLLLDEPLSNLDAKLRHEMRSEIRRICKETPLAASGGRGITTVYVTHDQKEALSMADHVAVMRAGVIAQIGPPRELYTRPRSRFVADFLGETNFLSADVLADDAAPGHLRLRAAAGDLTTAVFSARATPGARVVCSVRPESLRVATDGQSGLRGHIVETTYLGEVAQHAVELASPDASGERLVRLLEMRPREASQVGRRVTLTADPQDVVVVDE